MDGWMGGWVDGWMDGWVGGWMDGWVGGWMDGWMDGHLSLFLLVLSKPVCEEVTAGALFLCNDTPVRTNQPRQGTYWTFFIFFFKQLLLFNISSFSVFVCVHVCYSN